MGRKVLIMSILDKLQSSNASMVDDLVSATFGFDTQGLKVGKEAMYWVSPLSSMGLTDVYLTDVPDTFEQYKKYIPSGTRCHLSTRIKERATRKGTETVPYWDLKEGDVIIHDGIEEIVHEKLDITVPSNPRLTLRLNRVSGFLEEFERDLQHYETEGLVVERCVY